MIDIRDPQPIFADFGNRRRLLFIFDPFRPVHRFHLPQPSCHVRQTVVIFMAVKSCAVEMIRNRAVMAKAASDQTDDDGQGD